MPFRLGPGPVFTYECLVTARRWQTFAIRSVFVLILLVGLVLVWSEKVSKSTFRSIAELAQVGRLFHEVIVGIELTLVMLAAPAATAGAICVDKARGTLAHMLVTDLSNAEIVLGKLGGRLLPVLGAVLCTAPVLMIGTLLGGVDPVGLFGSLLVILGVAFLGSTLALCLSVWGTKTHEVMLATYVVWAIWLLTAPTIEGLTSWFGVGRPSLDWLMATNPFLLGLGATWRPIPIVAHFGFFAVTLILSAALAIVATVRVRSVAANQFGRAVRRRAWRLQLPRGARFLLPQSWLPAPGLDTNPVLWREWHRARPGRFSAAAWCVYFSFAFLFTGLFYSSLLMMGNNHGGFAAWTNGFLVSIGLLFLSVSASTALAEERVRGSLDVLMTTPIATRSIVLGKWLGSFRLVLAILISPALITFVPCLARFDPFGWLLFVVMILAMGSFVVSLGLAMATWQKRVGRAVTMTVGIYLLLAVGWLFLVLGMGGPRNEEIAMLSPFFGAGGWTFHLVDSGGGGRKSEALTWTIAYTWFYLIASAVLLRATLATFDRCMGRMPGRSMPVAKKVPEPALAELVS